MKNLILDEEKNIINEWKDFIDIMILDYKIRNNINLKKNITPRFIHWSNAEITSLNLANQRHNYMWNKWLNNITWIDLYIIFKDEPICVHGAKTLKLKDIAKNMHKLNIIDTIWDTNGIEDGLNAMQEANKYYNNKNKNPNIIRLIEEYNEIDCKVMWDIVRYLRINHT
jgi:hypothetical protein